MEEGEGLSTCKVLSESRCECILPGNPTTDILTRGQAEEEVTSKLPYFSLIQRRHKWERRSYVSSSSKMKTVFPHGPIRYPRFLINGKRFLGSSPQIRIKSDSAERQEVAAKGDVCEGPEQPADVDLSLKHGWWRAGTDMSEF